jgi:hypothetical protein
MKSGASGLAGGAVEAGVEGFAQFAKILGGARS